MEGVGTAVLATAPHTVLIKLTSLSIVSNPTTVMADRGGCDSIN